MITFVFGATGTGKSNYIINRLKADAESGTQAYLIVPEQQTVLREAETSKILAPSAQFTLEVLNFTRLANRVFRKFGGISSNYIAKSAKALIMWRALISSIPYLTEYANAAARDRGCVSMMLSAVSEFKTYRVTPSMLESAADELTADASDENDVRFSRRLKDISLIYSAFEQSLLSSYSDPSGDLDALAEKLAHNNFFENCNVYFDSFYGYTPQEINVMRLIFSQAKNVTITFCCPNPGSARANDPHFDFIKNTYAKVHKIAVLTKQTPEIISLETNIRHRSEDLQILERGLWNFQHSAAKIEPEHVKIIRAADNYDAAEAAALDIVRAIRSGLRYSEIAVIVRNIDTYRGIIDISLEKYGISYYISARTDVMAKPEIKLIISALSICTSNWRRDNVIGYIKTGLADITCEEADLFEKYCDTWNISGSRFTDGEMWFMNPGGYSENISIRNVKILEKVNSIRQKIVAPLQKLFAVFKNKPSITDVCRSVFEFLTDVNLSQHIKAEAEQMFLQGDKAGAAERYQLWGIICDVLDVLVDTINDAAIDNADQFSQLLKYVLETTDIGTIPTGTDEVTIGDASMLRLSEAKHVVVLGANEGEFPQSTHDDGIFSDADKVRLEGVGINLSSDLRMRNSEELFWFYRSVCCASDSVTIICSDSETGGNAKKSPSIGISRIRHLFPKLKTLSFSNSDIKERLMTRNSSYEYLTSTEGTTLGESLKHALSTPDNDLGEADKKRLEMIFSASKSPLTHEKVTLAPQIAGKLFGKSINMTQTRLESFVLCRFNYYCRYVLRLHDSVRSGFNPVDVGNFVHRILERFISRIIGKDGRVRTGMSETEIEDLVDVVIREYIEEVCYGELDKSNRLAHLFLRLRRTVLTFVRNLIAEFSQSDFVPRFFELKITDSDPESPSPIKFILPDGTSIMIFGIADRVDTYLKNNSVYIRVVDYKTGTKEFSLSDIALGLNLQLLLYLFAIWRSPPGNFRDKLTSAPKADHTEKLSGEYDVIPAGILYFSAKSPEVSVDSPPVLDEEIDGLINKKLVRNGLLLNDEKVLAAMENRLSGQYIPIKLTKSGAITKTKSLATLEDFGKIFNQVADTIKRIGGELKKGSADAIPYETPKISPCKYCTMKPICRRIKSL